MSQLSKVIFAFAGVFVAGAVAGGIVALRVGVQKVVQARIVQPSAPEDYPLIQMRRYIDKLGLTDDQKAKISPILDETGVSISALHKASSEGALKIREDSEKQISLLLNDGQRKALAEMQKERIEALRKQFSHGIRPGQGLGNDRDRRGTPGSAGPGSGMPRQGGLPGPESATNSSGQAMPPVTAPPGA